MEISSFLHPTSYTGEQKYEMLELNRKLESYLNHVRVLEEENQLLWGELQAMQRNQDTGGKREAQEEALSLVRKELQNAWRKKDHVELEISNLLEEIEELNILRQKEKSAQVEAKRKLEESKKALEDERRMQIWLKQQAAHLEKEISLQVQVHQEDLVALKSSRAFSKPVLMAPQHSQSFNLQGLGEEYSQRAAQAWREAAGVYQTEMKKLEESLDQTTAHMTLIKQEKKESKRQVQDLAKEMESAKAKRELMEKSMVQQRQRQNQDLQHLQAHVEVLEAEKLDLREQIGELLAESRNLLQMKMSLSLEVATYRALLESESLRVNNQSASKKNRTASLLEGITKSPGIPPGTQAVSSCLFTSPLNTTPRSITHKANLMTPIPAWSLTQKNPEETLKGPQATKEEEIIVRVENQKLKTSTTISEKHLTGAASQDHYRAEEETSSTAFEVPKALTEPKPILTSKVKEYLQEVLKVELGPVLDSNNENLPAEHPQTPESVSSSQHIEEAKSSEDGDEEETEVSTEMAQISHAPVSAWEENETVIPEERDVVSELEMESEDIVENGTQELRIDADHAELQLLGENTTKPSSPLLQEIPPLSADTLSPVEDDSEILTWADVKEDVIHFVEEESLKSAPEVERDSVKGAEEVEEKIEVEQAEWPGIEGLEAHEFDIKVQEEENETEQEKYVEQCKEEELINGKEERMIEEEIIENFGEQNAELMMNTYEKGDLVIEKAEAHMNKYQFVEHNAEDEQGQSDEDESLNISASWRTDPGEADSYVQENTLADTRPLIHYKSDEETDVNLPIYHLGVSEPTDSEEEREKHEGGSHWSHIIAKRFDTMEDLSEEPELGSMDNIVTDGSVQTMLRESMDEESVVENESGDTDSHVKTLMDDALVDQSESDLRNNSNEKIQGEEEEEAKIENYHLSTLLVEKQEESSQLHDWSASEDREMNGQQTILITQTNISKDRITEYNDNAENWNIESTEINPEVEREDKKNFDTPLAEPPQEQAFAEEPCEEVSTEIKHSDVLLFETVINEEQACPKEDDVQSNLSMLTHADITDILTTQTNISEDPITEYNDNAENWNIESTEINPEGEREDKKNFDTPLAEPSQEQVFAEEPCEEVSTDITHSDVLLFETAITEEQAYPKEDDVQSNLSMLTHADITDECSLHSHPESQTNTNNSDLEEPDSSEDESPNASQHSQLLCQSKMQTQQLDQFNETTMDVASNADPFFTGLLSGVLTEKSSEDGNAPQAEELENKQEQQCVVDSSCGGMGENADSLPQKWENVGYEITSASHSISSTAEEFGDVEMENNQDNMDILQGDALKEECQTNEKENDLHSFFSSSMKEGIWSATKFEMAATYDPNDQRETEKNSNDSINPNTTITFGEGWGSLERLPPTNNKSEKDMGTSIAQSMDKEGEEEKMPQAKQVQCRDVNGGDEETVHADDSTDEGDSWSSGEE